jgi:hypothetical protein
MGDPRVYLYRKAGRDVWVAELWLGDGRRKVWGTGHRDRAAAETAAWERLGELLGSEQPAMPPPAPSTAPHPADVPAAAFAGAEEASPEAPTSPGEPGGLNGPRGGPHGGWLERFDAWFFGELKQVFQLR